MESAKNNDSQDELFAPTQENRDAPSPDEGSIEVTDQRNDPGTDFRRTPEYFRNYCTESDSEEQRDFRLPGEKRAGSEEKQDLKKTIVKLNNDLESANKQIQDLKDHVGRVEEENMIVKKGLANSEAEKLQQRPQTVPDLNDEGKQEEFRIYYLQNLPGNKRSYYAVRRQKVSMRDMERDLLKKYPKAAFIAHVKTPNSVNTFNLITENIDGITRVDTNHFNYAGDSTELFDKIDKILMREQSLQLTRHNHGTLHDYFKTIDKKSKEKE